MSELQHSDFSLPATPRTSISLYEFPIQTKEESTYEYIQQGFGHLLSMWDMEAMRFFLSALEQEPDSLIATTGLALSLVGGDTHLADQQKASVLRLHDIYKSGKGSQYEQRFAKATLKLFKGNIKGWTEDLAIFGKRKETGWQVPSLLSHLFSRDGYSMLGQPKYKQKKTIKNLLELCNEFPNDPAPLVIYTMIQRMTLKFEL